MAVIYVRSTDGNNADNGSTWALAKATLVGALAIAAPGDRIWLSHVHAETQATAMTITSPGTAAAPVQILCGNDGAEPPTALATTATITTTGTSSINFEGFATCYGVAFIAGTGTGVSHLQWIAVPSWHWKLERCSLALAGTATTSRINVGAAGATSSTGLELINTSVAFGHVSQCFQVRCRFDWQNTLNAISGATLPTSLFLNSASHALGHVHVHGVDLSALGSGNNLVNVGTSGSTIYLFEACKLGASVAITTGTAGGPNTITVRLINGDSADTNYRYYKYDYQGEIFQETTILRTSGATDGTMPVSRKMVSSANSNFDWPLESDPLFYWNETIGSSVTITVEVVTDNVTLTDAEAWIEVEYLGTSGFPLGNFSNDRAADVLATPANQDLSTVAWTTSHITIPVKQKLSLTVTPQEKGLIRARVMLAKPSTVFYFDPLILAGSGRQFMVGASGYMNEAAGGGIVGRLNIVQNIGTY